MGAQYRRVTVAQGHTVTIRRVSKQPDRPGYVHVSKSHRPPFFVRASLWNEAPIADV